LEIVDAPAETVAVKRAIRVKSRKAEREQFNSVLTAPGDLVTTFVYRTALPGRNKWTG
jgi:hypothetical protein